MPQQTPQRTEDFNGMNKKTRYNNHNNNNNSQQQQKRNAEHEIAERFTLERAQQPRDTVNYECRVDGAAHSASADSRSVKTPTSEQQQRASPHVYENVKFDLRLSQQLLLHKFFRHNRAKSDAIYENLCRGCGYGVFEARGQLCNFCACIVNGLKKHQLTADIQTANVTADSADNIYENICAKCGALYSTDGCEHCLLHLDAAPVDDTPPPPPASCVSVQRVEQVASLSKSTSFGKRDKRSLFYGLIGSLKRRVKTPPEQHAPTRKHLQIVHNVDGFENVFRTQETFDLQRICQLKCQQLAKNSRSDQHIYGRLKCSETLADSAQTLPSGLSQSQSHDQLLLPASSADSLLDAGVGYQLSGVASRAKKAGSAYKRPRISKPRLLRSRSQNDTHKLNNNNNNNSATTTPSAPAKLPLYLADSVCYWLTSVRREVHSYRAHGSPLGDEHLELCQPKSVPAKNPLTYCATIASSGPLAPSAALLSNNLPNGDKSPGIKTTTTTTTTEINTATSELSHCDCCDSAAKEQQPLESAAGDGSAISPAVARMVRDFQRNLMAKQMQQQKQRPADPLPPTATTFTSSTAAARAPRSPRTPRSPRSPVATAQQRAKRQAIYLKIDNNNHDQHNNNDANVNCSPIRNRAAAAAAAATTITATQFTDETIAAAATAELCAVGEHGLAASRSAARQAITATSKRRGIHERDSEFVSDILSAFDHFLQRESDPNAPADAPNESRSDGAQRKPETDITAETISGGERDHVPAHSGRDGAAVTAYQRHDEDVAAITAVIDDAPAIATETGTNGDDQRSACQPAVIGDAAQQLPPRPIATGTVAISEQRERVSSAAACAPNAIAQALDIVQLLNDLLISRSLNNVVIYYDKPLWFFLHRVQRSLTRGQRPPHERLVRKFRRFYAHLQREFEAVSGRAPQRSSNLTLVQGGDFPPFSSVAVVGESAELLSVARNGSARARVEIGEAPLRRANAQIVVKRVSLSIEADAGCEVAGVEKVQVEGERSSAEPSHERVDGVVSGDGDSRSGGVMKNNSDEVVLRPKAKDASRRNEKALGKFIESVDDARVRELSEPKRPSSKCGQPAAEVNAVCAAGAATTTQATERSPSGSPKNSERAPQLPARDPKTSLSSTAATTKTTAAREHNSPPLPAKSESRLKDPKKGGLKMTVPTAAYSKPSAKSAHSNNNNNNNNSNNNNNNNSNNNNRDSNKNDQHQQRDESDDEEEDIYQPIWQFKTVGEVQERYQTDADYYDVSSLAAITATAAAAKSLRCNDSSLLLPSVLISDNVEDHGEWETDDEFMFSTQPVECGSETTRSDDGYSLNSSTMRSTGSAASTAASTSASASGSTVTGFESGSSTATLASAFSASLQHPLLRSVGIFYSLLEPKLRAIVYDYDRAHAPLYFAKRTPELAETSAADDSGIGRSPQERSPQPPPRTTSAAKSAATATAECGVGGRAKAAPKMQLLPDSVQAWKFMLLDVNYLEDEEDMIVSEQEILRAQQIKEDIDTQAAIAATPQQSILQRFKSASFGNLIDLPNEDDKKSIAERMRNKLQRGVFKLNVRSPKSEKKSRGIFRRTETASLYLEDGMKPKYPIFGAPLEQLELNQSTHPHVPRLVVDCVEYIERKDCILQDGLYRASGNKISIDELKQKLSESYIYDPKLLATDDIHTLTSLLKLFFRELGAPLIPQSTYERLGSNVTDATGIEALRVAIDQMPEPNRSTLQFLVRHLKNVAACSAENRMPASNLAIVWGPCIFSANQLDFVDIGRMNTLAKVLIENYERIFGENERLVS